MTYTTTPTTTPTPENETFEGIATTKSPLSAEDLARLRTWDYWEKTKPVAKNTIVAFLESGENVKSFIVEPSFIRHDIHEVAQMMGLQTKSTNVGQDRVLHIWKPAGYDFFLPQADDVKLRRNQRHRERRRHAKEIRHEKEERWIAKKYCGDCGRHGDECELGIRRDGEYQCHECNEEDPYWSAFKWESLVGMYPGY